MVKVFRQKYEFASKKEKIMLVDELVRITGFNRNYASQVLRGHYEHKKPSKKKQYRKPYYGANVLIALEKIWQVLGNICGKRMVPFMSEIINKLEEFGEIKLEDSTRKKLKKISASTIDRMLRPAKRRLGRKGTSMTKKPRYLIDKIRVKTFGEWKDTPPGFLQMDLVAHNGGNVYGGFLHTLTATDVALGWTHCTVVRNKTKLQMLKALLMAKKGIPHDMLGMHTDNGAEFINDTIWKFAQKYNIEFTRGRPYKKNDNAHVEQKNYSVLRRNTGYLRYDKPEHVPILNGLFKYLNQYANYFQPIMILVEKHRIGSKAIRKYDKPKTPYQRLLDSPGIPNKVKNAARELYKTLNPAELRRQIDAYQFKLIETASPVNMKQGRPPKVRRKKRITHSKPKGQRFNDPFHEKIKVENMRKARKLLDDERGRA